LTNAPGESQAVDLLVVVVVFILLPVRIEIKSIVNANMECRIDEVGTRELMECWEMQLEWVDTAK